MITALLIAYGLAATLVALVLARQLYLWERQLRAARIAVGFKGKTKMTPRLMDLLNWGNSLRGDRLVNGQVFYKAGGTTIAIIKPPYRKHGKTEHKTRKPEPPPQPVTEENGNATGR